MSSPVPPSCWDDAADLSEALPLVSSFRSSLLEWFDAHQRDLPWRKTTDPYAIWISEIMLQQTQVATVLDYYTRWMAAFPDVSSLAEADIDAVLKLWAGLGYYRRARSLHEAANMIVADFDGALPDDVKRLKKLKGIGDYTAGAIASIAFGQVEPLVDGNVERVFARQFAIAGDPKDRANQKRFWSIARSLVDPLRPGDFNQALMELGATCCTPRNPTCLLCPVRSSCLARALGDPTRFPATVKRSKAKPVQVDSLVIYAARENAFLLVKRPADGLLPGLLEAPSSPHVPLTARGKQKARQANDEAAANTTALAARRQRLLAALTHEDLRLPLDEATLEQAMGAHELGAVQHVFSHLRMTIDVHLLKLDAMSDDFLTAVSRQPEGRLLLVPRQELMQQALSSAQKKVFEKVLAVL